MTKSMLENESSFSGNASDVTGNGAAALLADVPAMEAPSKKPKPGSRSGSGNSAPTVLDLLALLQEDLRNLQAAGVRVKIIPKLYPFNYMGFVLENVLYNDGDFEVLP